MKKLFTNRIFLLGLLFRFLVMPFTGHWDIRGINFAVYNLPFKGITNVYEVAAKEEVEYFVNVNFGRDYFIYPPLNYFTLAGFMTLLKPFYGPEFVAWIEGWGNQMLKVITHPHVWRYLFLMKIPYLVFDIFLLTVLLKFFSRNKDQKLALIYWWLNPIVIYLPYIWGQFDIIPTAIMLLGVYRGVKHKPYQAALLFGLAASFKNYPLLLLPFLAAIMGKRLWDMVKIFAVGILPFLLTTAPYWNHAFFRKTVLFSWQSQKMLDFMWPIAAADGVYPFIIGYTLILLWTLYKLRGRVEYLSLPMVMTLFSYYATTNFHQQWFLWILPYLVIYAVKDAKLRLIGVFVVGLFFFRALEIQANVTSELFIWLAPAFDDLPKSRYLLGLVYDIHKLRNLVNSAYLATALFTSLYLVNSAKEEKS